MMTKTHATGAAMSYGMRYLLKMIFNAAIGEADTGREPVRSGRETTFQANIKPSVKPRPSSNLQKVWTPRHGMQE